MALFNLKNFRFSGGSSGTDGLLDLLSQIYEKT